MPNTAISNRCLPFRLPLEGAVRRTEGVFVKKQTFRLRHTSSVSQARHLLLKEKVNFYCQHCDFERANAVRPYDVDFAFAIILRMPRMSSPAIELRI